MRFERTTLLSGRCSRWMALFVTRVSRCRILKEVPPRIGNGRAAGARACPGSVGRGGLRPGGPHAGPGLDGGRACRGSRLRRNESAASRGGVCDPRTVAGFRRTARSDRASMRSRQCGRPGGWARIASSSRSVPYPGPDGSLRYPSSISGTRVTRSSFHGTSSMSISMTRKFGIAAQKWALISVERCP